MTRPTRQSKRKASRRGEVRARLMWTTSVLELEPMCFQTARLHSYKHPVFVLPADAENVERMAAQIRRAIIDNETDSPEIILAALGLNLTPSKP